MIGSTVERAQHRWREILPLVGIDTRYLTNSHGPCPLCGGKDRYRFDDRDGTGSYFCSQCGAGVGIIMVRKLKGWDYKTACDEIDRILGDVGDIQPAPDKPARNKGNGAALAKRLGRTELTVEVHVPPIAGTDWLDVLNYRGGR
jgi:putative DNA primase/helicase